MLICYVFFWAFFNLFENYIAFFKAKPNIAINIAIAMTAITTDSVGKRVISGNGVDCGGEEGKGELGSGEGEIVGPIEGGVVGVDEFVDSVASEITEIT